MNMSDPMEEYCDYLENQAKVNAQRASNELEEYLKNSETSFRDLVIQGRMLWYSMQLWIACVLIGGFFIFSENILIHQFLQSMSVELLGVIVFSAVLKEFYDMQRSQKDRLEYLIEFRRELKSYQATKNTSS